MKLTVILICLVLAFYGLVLGELVAREEGKIARLVKLYQPSIEVAKAAQIEESVLFWVEERGINLRSFLAIIIQESKFDPDAESAVRGDRGLGQVSRICLSELKRVYGKEFDFDRLFEIDYNIEVSSLHYLYCVQLASHRRAEAIARYRTTFRPEESGYYAWRVLRIREGLTISGNIVK